MFGAGEAVTVTRPPIPVELHPRSMAGRNARREIKCLGTRVWRKSGRFAILDNYRGAIEDLGYELVGRVRIARPALLHWMLNGTWPFAIT